MTMSIPVYDVALSYSGENRDLVEAIASQVKQETGLSVFYDRDHAARLWGDDLEVSLHEIYSTARSVVVFTSQQYRSSKWCKYERDVLEIRADSDASFLLPVRLDRTPLVAIPSTVAGVQAFEMTPDQTRDTVVAWLKDRLAGTPRTPGSEDLLVWQVKYVLQRLNPVGMLQGAPAAHDEAVQEILVFARTEDSVSALAGQVRRIFARDYSPRLAGPVSRYQPLAAEIWRLTHSTLEEA